MRWFAPYRALDRRIWLIAAMRCINTMGFSIVMPFMFIYLVGQRGTSATLVGLIYLVAGVAGAATQVISGEIADRHGRRLLMVVALGLRAVNMVLLGIAASLEAGVGVFAFLVITNAILRSLLEPAANAAVTDLTPPDQRVAAFGLQRLAINLSWAMGPAIGGAFAHASYALLFFFAAPVTLAAAYAASKVTDTQRRAPTFQPWSVVAATDAMRRNPAFFVSVGLAFLASILVTQVYSTLSLFLSKERGFSEGAIGLIYTVNGLGVVLLQVPGVAVIERGVARAMVSGAIIYSLVYFAFGYAASFVEVALCMAALTFGEVIFMPALNDVAARLGDPRRLGRAFGVFGLMQQLGVSLAPFVGGIIFDLSPGEPRQLWSILAGGMFVVAMGYLAFVRRFRDRMRAV